MSAFHGQQTTADGLHVLPRYTFNTQADMLAAAYTAADDGCCIQVGAAAPYTYYIMKDSTQSANAALGYVELAAGTGDFSGPAGATAGNVVSFADGTGKVGSDSGRVAANIPTNLPVPVAEGGTASTTVSQAMETLSPAITQELWVNQNYAGGAPTGSVNAPYPNISAALSAIGPATSGAEEIEQWVVHIAPGFYDENLNIPELRSITLTCDGFAALTDTTLTNARSININAALAPASGFPKTLKFNNIYMSGPMVFAATGVAPNHEVFLNNCNWINAGFAGTCVDATAWQSGPQFRLFLKDSRLATSGADLIRSNTTHAGADCVLSQAVRCDLSGGDIQMLAYSQLMECRFGGAHRWKGATALGGSNVIYPQGYIDCSWVGGGAHTIEAQSPGDFYVDSMSYRRSQGIISFVGSATFIGDPYTSLSNAYMPLTAPDWQVSAITDQNMKKAIDRLAAAVNGLLGGAGIP